MKDNTHEAISVQCLGLSVYLYVYNRINSNQLFSSLLSSPYNSCLMAFVESGVLLQTAVVSSALNTNESKRYERIEKDRIGTHRFNLKRFVSRLSLFSVLLRSPTDRSQEVYAICTSVLTEVGQGRRSSCPER